MSHIDWKRCKLKLNIYTASPLYIAGNTQLSIITIISRLYLVKQTEAFTCLHFHMLTLSHACRHIYAHTDTHLLHMFDQTHICSSMYMHMCIHIHESST